MTERINVKLQSVTEYDGETFYHLLCEYFPRHEDRAARISRYVRLKESFDLEVLSPKLPEWEPEDKRFFEAPFTDEATD